MYIGCRLKCPTVRLHRFGKRVVIGNIPSYGFLLRNYWSRLNQAFFHFP
jgi:hypothetical protein